jgi:hypothetical protein
VSFLEKFIRGFVILREATHDIGDRGCLGIESEFFRERL